MNEKRNGNCAFLRIFTPHFEYRRTMTKKIILALLIALVSTGTILAKPKKRVVYMFGVSVSFTDSVAYITEIQRMDPVYIESKTGFLYDRSIYSQQLQMFMDEKMGRPNTTCTVFFSKKKKKMENKYLKVMKNYKKRNKLNMRQLESGTFKFKPEEWTEHETI